MATFTPESVTVAQIAKLIDHSLLRPELTDDDVREGCGLAARYHVASVCVRPGDVVLAVDLLRGTDVLVGTVAGFPHGGTTTRIKAAEAALAVGQGAAEVDMVINIGCLRSGKLAEVEADIRAVVAAADGATVKVILENAYLTAEQIVAGCQAAERAGAHFVKTSTGFANGGATMDDLALMRSAVSPAIEVKAAGGVPTLDTLLAMAAIGVTRFGAIATAAILDDLAHRQEHGRPAAGAVASGGAY
ncbi:MULTISPECIES: deoxyribose-phosphate aldolase [Micromonospora]|uniref:Deoxyribose-phosphate aldolase n=1 Tax=Micromonospora sicca TaxID=2202420 RepID=A0A317DCV5_9ACTN|nr:MULTISPECIES: deoxyribose-phosphate aldolase [unclassified Micromonospora]MBM0225106.1 deoxyribose-phosphate aldolase [Micromonospora sp. ATA51]PWR12274.1 deoxyribose-phosphate aldolase [Micromonospora sp. 4G51]